MSRWFKVLFSCLMATSLSAENSIDITKLDGLPPGEQYRQLSLILLISGGAEPVLVDSLSPMDNKEGGRASSGFNPDDYKTPLIRIVDQESMLAGAAFLLQFAHESNEEIKTRLAVINANNPVLISMVNLNAITEDAIIIRNAIADAIAYSELADNPEIKLPLENYRTRTIRIRNIMEFEQFDEELDRLTEEAILSVGGKLDAYQRMFDEEVDTKGLDRQFDAAEYIYNRTEKFDAEAGKLTEEIMKNVIFSQSQPGTG